MSRKLTPEQQAVDYCQEQLDWIARCRDDMNDGTQYSDGDPHFFKGMESACTTILTILSARTAESETERKMYSERRWKKHPPGAGYDLSYKIREEKKHE